MIFNNKSDFVLALIVTLSVFCSYISLYLFPKDFTTFFWAIFFSLFIVYFRLGNTKLKQIQYLIYYSVLMFIILCIVGLSTLVPNTYYVMSFATLIFMTLCVSRYIPGGRSIGVFITVYVIIFYAFYPHLDMHTLKSILIDILCGLCFSLFFTVLFTLALPLVKIAVIPIDKSTVLLKQSFRVAVSITIASFITQIYHLANPFWVYMSILIINQTHLGLSVKKAIERFFGTLIGAIISAIVASYIFEAHPQSLYLCFIVIFLNLYFIRLNYFMGIIFATILVTASYYILKPPIGIHEFIFNRIIDTFIGLVIGVLGEILIFPQSLIQIIRNDIKKYYLITSEIFNLLGKGSNIELVPNKIATLDTLRHEFANNLKLIRNELITKVAKKYSYIHDVYTKINSIEILVKQLVKEDITDIDKEIFITLVEAMNILYNIYPKLQINEEEFAEIIARLGQSNKFLVTNDTTVAITLKKLINDIIELFELYQVIKLTPYWKPTWSFYKT